MSDIWSDSLNRKLFQDLRNRTRHKLLSRFWRTFANKRIMARDVKFFLRRPYCSGATSCF